MCGFAGALRKYALTAFVPGCVNQPCHYSRRQKALSFLVPFGMNDRPIPRAVFRNINCGDVRNFKTIPGASIITPTNESSRDSSDLDQNRRAVRRHIATFEREYAIATPIRPPVPQSMRLGVGTDDHRIVMRVGIQN